MGNDRNNLHSCLSQYKGISLMKRAIRFNERGHKASNGRFVLHADYEELKKDFEMLYHMSYKTFIEMNDMKATLERLHERFVAMNRLFLFKVEGSPDD